jgi:hypothetical protein
MRKKTMSDRLYLSPNSKIETEIPFFVVFERDEAGSLVAKEIKGVLSSSKLSEKYEFVLIPQGPGVEEASTRYMGEVSLRDPGEYRVQVSGKEQIFLVEQRADNLSFLREFGVFFIGSAITLVVVFCWAMISKRKRTLRTA